MIHARKDYNRIQDPDHIIPEEEPMFLLRASDRVAPKVVDLWAKLAEFSGASTHIVNLALNHAKLIREWQAIHGSKIPDVGATND